jgi:hypothetical protein
MTRIPVGWIVHGTSPLLITRNRPVSNATRQSDFAILTFSHSCDLRRCKGKGLKHETTIADSSMADWFEKTAGILAGVCSKGGVPKMETWFIVVGTPYMPLSKRGRLLC